MHTRKIFTEVCKLCVHSVIKGHQGHNSHHMWRVPRNALQRQPPLRPRRSVSPLITAGRFRTRARALGKKQFISAERKRCYFFGDVFESFEPASAVETVWQPHASRWGGGKQVYTGSRNTEKRRRRLKKVSIKKAPAVRTEQAAASELTSEPWAQPACLSHCLTPPTPSPQPPLVCLFASS